MSTILDALHKASEERTHVRSPLMKGDLYNQTRLQPAMAAPAPVPSAHQGAATAALATGALVLTASVFIGIVMWASHTTTARRAEGSFNAPIVTASSAAPVAPASPLAEPPRNAGRRVVDQYLGAQLLPTVPINVQGSTQGQNELATSGNLELPPPEPLQVASAAYPRSRERERAEEHDGELMPDLSIPAEDLVDPDLEIGESIPVIDDGEESSSSSRSRSRSSGSGSRAEESSSNEPRWRLEGIVWDEKTPMAIVNGAIVGVGDRVNGATVSSIRQDGVVISADGTDITVTY